MSRIHIKIADAGWILEKCAREIARRSRTVSFGLEANNEAELQYYINYSARRERVSPIEVAFFTHSERDPAARSRYFDAAREVDHRVCMSRIYADELRDEVKSEISIIAPGVDLELFRPKVRIGVIGRTYHTGRKGEALVARVMDIPDIEWHFTGSGWPGPSEFVPGDAIADFYNKLDYVLIPALYEGGPMSVLEGLACGKPIISSNVGWAEDYPHIPFENGNADSLRAVLEGLVCERHNLRASVMDCTWERWADEHLALFEKLLLDRPNLPKKATSPYSEVSAVLLTHGSESTSLGGPSVRVPATVKALKNVGVAAELPGDALDNLSSAEIAHVYNVWTPDSCLKSMQRARAVGKKVVLSSIFMNLSNHATYARDVPALFHQNSGKLLEHALRSVARRISSEPNLPIREIYPGYHSQVAACIDYADHVICLSDYEAASLDHIGANSANRSIIRNPVDANRFTSADPKLFRQKYDLNEYILCVGRIESRKNQLILAESARRIGKPIVFIGHEGEPSYAALVRERAGEKALFIPRIEPNDPLLGSAFAGATTFALTSWSEGAPLAALEAASTGVPLVLSDRSSEREYFGDVAEYVNPADLDATMAALQSALLKSDDTERAAQQRRYVATHYSWEEHATKTADVYCALLSTSEVTKPNSIAHSRIREVNGDENRVAAQGLPTPISEEKGVVRSADPKIYFDVTDFVYSGGRPSGVPRVVEQAFLSLLSLYPDRLTLFAWKRRSSHFFELSPEDLARPGISKDVELRSPTHPSLITPAEYY